MKLVRFAFYVVGLVAVSSLCVAPSYAASIYKQSLSQKSNAYAQNAVFMGGRAGQIQTLVKVRRVASTKVGIERVILDLGNSLGKPVVESGYFHVSVDAKNSRVVIELSQMTHTLTTEKSLRQLFAKSSLIGSVDFTTDPEDSTGTVVLNLRKSVRAEVFSLPGHKKQTARLVLDLKSVPSKEKI